MKYGNILRALYTTPWAILPETLAVMVELANFRSLGGVLESAEIEARLEAAAAKNGPRNNGGKRDMVAVIPIYGVISPRADMMSESSGGTNVESIRTAFRAALRDDDIGSILFDVDSPGGNVEGIEELATEIREARGVKPMTAVANYVAASAAYWLAAQADEVVVTPSGSVGSIGVIAAHKDMSVKNAQEGIKTTLVTHGKHKAEMNEFEPLSAEAKEQLQARVSEMGEVFEAAIAQGRGVSKDIVSKNYGQGRMFSAKKSVSAGLADRVETFDNAVVRVFQSAAQAAALAPMTFNGGWWTPTVQTNGNDTFPTVTTGGLVIPSGSSIIQSEAPVSDLKFAERLALVADEVEAVVAHARNRATLRATEGRHLSVETRTQLLRLVALRPLLDEAETLAQEPQEEQVQGRNVGKNLELMIAAYGAGLPIEDFKKGVTS